MLCWDAEDAEIKISVFLFVCSIVQVVAAFCLRCYFCFGPVLVVLFPRLSVISGPCVAVLQPNPARLTGYSVMEERPVRPATRNAQQRPAPISFGSPDRHFHLPPTIAFRAGRRTCGPDSRMTFRAKPAQPVACQQFPPRPAKPSGGNARYFGAAAVQTREPNLTPSRHREPMSREPNLTLSRQKIEGCRAGMYLTLSGALSQMRSEDSYFFPETPMQMSFKAKIKTD